MFCSIKSPAQRRYLIRFGIAVGVFYPLCTILAVWGILRGHPHGLLTYLLAIFPTLPIIWALVATGLYLAEEKDEFMRNVQVQSLLGGIGATLVATTMWGFLEDFAHVRHMDLMLVWLIFWFSTAISYGLVSWRYR
ncbi:MAG: hypothetical protein WBE72_02105 [Terracidiphilus sp.]